MQIAPTFHYNMLELASFTKANQKIPYSMHQWTDGILFHRQNWLVWPVNCDKQEAILVLPILLSLSYFAWLKTIFKKYVQDSIADLSFNDIFWKKINWSQESLKPGIGYNWN